MVAKDKGLDLKFVANGASTTGEIGKDIGGVVVPAGSDIQSAKDLSGKTVSVNNLSNIGDTTIKSVVEKDGGDPNSVKFVEVAFPDAPAALANKQVDAAWILEPFLSKAVAEGGKVVSWNFVEMHPELDIAGYFTKAETIQGKAELTQKFTRAMNKSLEYAQQHPQEVRDIVGTYTKIDEAARAAIVLPRYRVEFNQDAFKTLGDAAAKLRHADQSSERRRTPPVSSKTLTSGAAAPKRGAAAPAGPQGTNETTARPRGNPRIPAHLGTHSPARHHRPRLFAASQ